MITKRSDLRASFDTVMICCEKGVHSNDCLDVFVNINQPARVHTLEQLATQLDFMLPSSPCKREFKGMRIMPCSP